ncbi:hypothetical protein BDV12DRAFT_47100 [Aspergillus spectabilis]
MEREHKEEASDYAAKIDKWGCRSRPAEHLDSPAATIADGRRSKRRRATSDDNEDGRGDHGEGQGDTQLHRLRTTNEPRPQARPKTLANIAATAIRAAAQQQMPIKSAAYKTAAVRLNPISQKQTIQSTAESPSSALDPQNNVSDARLPLNGGRVGQTQAINNSSLISQHAVTCHDTSSDGGPPSPSPATDVLERHTSDPSSLTTVVQSASLPTSTSAITTINSGTPANQPMPVLPSPGYRTGFLSIDGMTRGDNV